MIEPRHDLSRQGAPKPPPKSASINRSQGTGWDGHGMSRTPAARARWAADWQAGVAGSASATTVTNTPRRAR